MLVSSLDGKISKWNLDTIDKLDKSQLHIDILDTLKELFNTMMIYEEVQIEVKSHKYLYLDFYIPLLHLAIEGDGEQHSKYNKHFFKNKYNFLRQNINDNLKSQWCKLNNITLIRLNKHDRNNWKSELSNFGYTDSSS